MAEQKLLESLAGVRRRLLSVSLAAGLGWGLVGVLIVLIACAWVDLALDLPSGIRSICSLGAIGCGILLLGWAAIAALRDSSQGALARRLDAAADGRGQILSGVDLFQQYPPTSGAAAAAAQTGTLPAAMARIAIERAASLASRVRAASAVPGKPVFAPILSLGGILLTLGIVGLIAPRLFATQWSRFTDPFGDHPPYSAITFDVKPGDTMVRYGGGWTCAPKRRAATSISSTSCCLPAQPNPRRASRRRPKKCSPCFPSQAARGARPSPTSPPPASISSGRMAARAANNSVTA
jgi:hypothetical protein